MVYHQHDQNSFCLSILAYAFKALNKLVAENEIATHISASFTYYLHAVPDIIKFSNSILLDKARKFGEQQLRYKLETWNKTGTFYIMNNISERVTVVQLMDSLGSVKHALSVVGKWIFDSYYEKSLMLTIESLNLICASYDEDQ